MALNRITQAPPTFRAGANLRDPTASGFSRVSILQNPDMFPDQGYEFRDRGPKPPTNSYRLSEDSPFNNSFKHSSAWQAPPSRALASCMDNMMRTEKVCNRVAAQAIAAPADGEIKHLYSQIAAQAVQKERQAQILMKEQMRLEQMKEDAYWANVEQEQGLMTQTVQQNYQNRMRTAQQTLRKDYENQFELHRKALEEERREGEREALKLKQLQKREEQKERERQLKLKEEAEERKKDFQRRNEEILQRRQKRIEDDIAAEELIMKQKAEQEKIQDERNAYLKRKRDEKNRIRERLIDDQSKRLAKLYAQQQRVQSTAESEIAKREEAERQRRLANQKRLNDEKREDYIKYMREKSNKIANQVDTPDYTTDDTEAEREFDRKMKALARKRIMQEQMAQAAARKEQERRERWEELHQPKNVDTMYFLKDNEW